MSRRKRSGIGSAESAQAGLRFERVAARSRALRSLRQECLDATERALRASVASLAW